MITDSLNQLFEFIHKGGELMWFIGLLALLLWSLIFERLWYLSSGFKHDFINEKVTLENFHVDNSRHIQYLQEACITRLHQKIEQYAALIKTLVLLCPLFGLLGTVTGMISVFDVIALDSMSDVKLMASGISRATIPTMASMVISITGIFAYSFIKRKIDAQKQFITSQLKGGLYA